MARSSSKRGAKRAAPRRKAARKAAKRPKVRARPKAKRVAAKTKARRKTGARKPAVKRSAAKAGKSRSAAAPKSTLKPKAALRSAPAPGRPASPSSAYEAAHARSLADPEGFWAEAAAGIDWIYKWDQVLDRSNAPFYRWFVGGQLNTCYNAVDRHVNSGRGDQAAVIYDSPVTNTIRTITFRQLKEETARFAGALAELGVRQGDRVILYMPMVPEAAIAMLGCARIGAIHSVVFGGFASAELATRIDDSKPKVIVSASCGVEIGRIIPYKPLLDAAIDLAHHRPQHCLILQRPMAKAELKPGRDVDWAEAVA